MNPQELTSALEAIIYAADEPVTLDQMAKSVEAEKPEVRAALDALVALSQAPDRGVEIRKVAGGWKMYTKPQHHDVVRKFVKSLRPPVRLTMPALETLAVVAYKQPVTGPEINEIRGVNCGGVLKTLLEKRLITTAGRKPVIGRPILYRTSKDFLMRFGLSDLEELPSLKEFEQLAQAALGTDDGIAPIEPEDGATENRAPGDRTVDEQAGAENAEVEAATGETAEGEAPKVAAAAVGATTSPANSATPVASAETLSTTHASVPKSSADSATPEVESAEEMISGADGD
ncbi:MAG: SMC-Scp complex subunit ScpB [Candidatus Acidiferrales bacterium]